MKTVIEKSRRIWCLIVLAAVSFSGAAGARVASGQKKSASELPPFLVRLDRPQSTFYHDENIGYGIFRRSGRPESKGCSFGGWGLSVQLLKNGRVIYERPVGPVSRTASNILEGIRYQGIGGSAPIVNVVNDEDVNLKDDYQIRTTCGEEISEPSKPFHLSPWSEPVEGIHVLIRPLKTEFQVGEPIKIEATIRNSGTRPRRVPLPFAADGYSIGFWRLGPYWDDPRPVSDDYLERSLRILRPGESQSAILDLNNFRGSGTNTMPGLSTQPGTHRVWFSVFFHQDDEYVPAKYRQHLWREELTTNVIKIVVK